MRAQLQAVVIGVAAVLPTVFCACAYADVYLLASGGQVCGELTNRDETPRQKFVIRTVDGATITLERSQVKQIVSQSPAELEYEKIRPTFADTSEDQLRLADWCREKNL
ncbi:MAG TPA: hypothetical protein VGI75_14865, partial [Pirellulales bacterium]